MVLPALDIGQREHLCFKSDDMKKIEQCCA